MLPQTTNSGDNSALCSVDQAAGAAVAAVSGGVTTMDGNGGQNNNSLSLASLSSSGSSTSSSSASSNPLIPSSSSSSVASSNGMTSGRKIQGMGKGDESIYKMAPEAVDPAILSRGALSRRQYTKTALLQLRDEVLSRKLPDCINAPKLLTLGVLKRDQSNYLNQNGGTGGGNSGNNGSSSGGGGGVGRAISGGGGLSGGGGGSNNPKNLVDQRNVSSSLMPAFMKRRIVGNSNNNSSSGGNSNNSNDPKERIRKDQDCAINLSPQRKSINMGCQMPNASSHPEREGGGGVRERRIGSGRLPPRDVNWDYRPDKDPGSEAEYNNYRPNMMNSYRDHRNSSNNQNNTERPNNDYRERYDRRNYNRNNDYDRGDNSRDNSSYVRRFISDLANQHPGSNSGNSGGGGAIGNNVGNMNDRRRQYSDSRNEEPEWFSGGPTSQHDTIELRGFDESDEMISYSGGGNPKNMSQKHLREQHQQQIHHQQQQQQQQQQGSSGKTGSNSNEGNHLQDVAEDVEPVGSTCTSPPPARSTPTKKHNDTNNNTNDDKGKGDDKKSTEEREKHIEFNFEAFLNVDPLNNILVGDPKARETGSSRFSQWFKRSGDPFQNPKSANDSRRSSLHEDMNNVLNVSLGVEGNSPNNRVNGPNTGADSEKYFAPISPAANNQTNTLLEFLQKGKFNSAVATGMLNNMVQNVPGSTSLGYSLDKQKPGMIPSVEELEARMRKNEPGGVNNAINPFGQILSGNLHQQISQIHSNSGPQQQDMEAFKKLLEQIAPGVKGTAATAAGVTAMSAALQAQQQQQQIVLQQMINRAKQDELKRLFQQQQHQLHQQIQQRNNLQQQRMNDLLIKIASGKVTRNDVFKRPEAQAIVQGMLRGEITTGSLQQQLTHPNTSNRYRDIIASILHYLHSNSRVASPSLGAQQILSPIPSQTSQQQTGQQVIPTGQQATQQQQQQPGQQTNPQSRQETNSTTGLPQRIPSPRELQYHTQTIMQNALIKKKLEEQQENYRRRQEIQKQQQHQQCPGQPSAGTDDVTVCVTPLNFPHGSPPPPVGNKQQHPQSSQINSPTPLAFTPTSVLRKMTAEKDSFLAASTATVATIENVKSLQAANKAMHSLLMPNLTHTQPPQGQTPSQPRMILGGGSTVQSQNQQNPATIGGMSQPISPGSTLQQAMRNNTMKWNQMNLNQLPLNKPLGRPILKGGPTPPAAATAVSAQPMLPPQISYGTKIEFQQMQQQAQQQQQQQKQQQPVASQQQQSRNNPQQPNLLLSQMQQQQQQHQQHQQQQQHLQQLFQQRQRAAMRAQYQQMQYHHHIMHQQAAVSGANALTGGINAVNETAPQVQQTVASAGGSNSGAVTVAGGSNSGSGGGSAGNSQPQPPQQVGSGPQTTPGGIINYQRDGGLSPTSNQLARWFSPELLAQASAGKLPSLNMGQALSLEEFERSIQHSSATVHN